MTGLFPLVLNISALPPADGGEHAVVTHLRRSPGLKVDIISVRDLNWLLRTFQTDSVHRPPDTSERLTGRQKTVPVTFQVLMAESPQSYRDIFITSFFKKWGALSKICSVFFWFCSVTWQRGSHDKERVERSETFTSL